MSTLVQMGNTSFGIRASIVGLE